MGYTMDRPSRVTAAERGSVLVIVLVTLVFAATALLAFVERAGDDLLVEARAADAARLRAEAYSALETTLAVLEDFRLTGGALRSLAEGWGDPLGWVGYGPMVEGRTVEVTFVDESGKLPLPNTEFLTLVALFEHEGLTRNDAERLADALLVWSRKDYVPVTPGASRAEDYERAGLPFVPPRRSLRSFSELAAIDGVREQFFDEMGKPNELWVRFTAAVSLYNYPRPNLNAAPEAVLAALGAYTETQRAQLRDYFSGTGAYLAQGPGYFRSPEDAGLVLGEQAVAPGFAAQVRALRINVTVRQGLSSFQLSAVVAPPNGARVVPPVGAAETTLPPTSGQNQATPSSATAATAAANLNYPFTLLEITENAAMSVLLAADAAETP
ncbi:hypothetical protein MASR2M8_03040 [Opitutaceae bacterium]